MISIRNIFLDIISIIYNLENFRKIIMLLQFAKRMLGAPKVYMVI